jgi:hypothetical protein
MREDLAAVNVTRSYTLAGTNIAIFTFMLFFLYPRFKSGRINPVLFQATLIAMGVATFSPVFATLHYYWCSLSGRMSDIERTLLARRLLNKVTLPWPNKESRYRSAILLIASFLFLVLQSPHCITVIF